MQVSFTLSVIEFIIKGICNEFLSKMNGHTLREKVNNDNYFDMEGVLMGSMCLNTNLFG
jgi:hypothetical protein